MTTKTLNELKIGDKVHLGTGAQWEGDYVILQIIKSFKNGKLAVAVNFKGKNKVFHLEHA